MNGSERCDILKYNRLKFQLAFSYACVNYFLKIIRMFENKLFNNSRRGGANISYIIFAHSSIKYFKVVLF